MELVNETALETGWTLGFEKDGRELLLIVAKGTFDFPVDGGVPSWPRTSCRSSRPMSSMANPGSAPPAQKPITPIASFFVMSWSTLRPTPPGAVRCRVLTRGSASANCPRPSRCLEIGVGTRG